MTSSDHHEWITAAAGKLVLGGETLWQVMYAAWVGNCLPQEDAEKVIAPIRSALL